MKKRTLIIGGIGISLFLVMAIISVVLDKKDSNQTSDLPSNADQVSTVDKNADKESPSDTDSSSGQSSDGTAVNVIENPYSDPVDEDGNIKNPDKSYLVYYNESPEGQAVAKAFDIFCEGLEIKSYPIKQSIDAVVKDNYIQAFDLTRTLKYIGNFDLTVFQAAQSIFQKGVSVKRVGYIIPTFSKADWANDYSHAKYNNQEVEAQALLKASIGIYYEIKMSGLVHIDKETGENKLTNDFKYEEVKAYDPNRISSQELDQLLSQYYAR